MKLIRIFSKFEWGNTLTQHYSMSLRISFDLNTLSNFLYNTNSEYCMEDFKNLQFKDPSYLNNNTPLLFKPLRVLVQIILSLIIRPFKKSLLVISFTLTQFNATLWLCSIAQRRSQNAHASNFFSTLAYLYYGVNEIQSRFCFSLSTYFKQFSNHVLELFWDCIAFASFCCSVIGL